MDSERMRHMTADPVSILQAATTLSAMAHAGQFIRTSDIPFIAHPVGVSLAVSCLFGCSDPEVSAAALLHDTLEKTRLSADEIADRLGPRVLALVVALTKDKNARGKAYWERLYGDVWEARLIKMADALDHLDCPAEDLESRIKSGRRALILAYSNEVPIRRARGVLESALMSASLRLKRYA
jgi:(p)ppGpp synthase/HD superfamily hydrolase